MSKKPFVCPSGHVFREGDMAGVNVRDEKSVTGIRFIGVVLVKKDGELIPHPSASPENRSIILKALNDGKAYFRGRQK